MSVLRERMMAKPDKLKMDVAISGIPEALWEMRRELATLLREHADNQQDDVVGWAVAKSLRAVADVFETGAAPEDASGG